MTAREEAKRKSINLKSKVGLKNQSKIVVIGPEGGRDLTVIDGVHRAVRLCLYYMVRGKETQKDGEAISQQAFLSLTPNPIRHSRKQWADVGEFFEGI